MWWQVVDVVLMRKHDSAFSADKVRKNIACRCVVTGVICLHAVLERFLVVVALGMNTL